MESTQLDLRRQALKQRLLARPLATGVAFLRAARLACWPIFDLVVRLWLAEVFFVSGVLKAADWDNALNLAANEYPVSWLDQTTAAWLGVIVELGGAVLLTLGLGTRMAAAAMLILALVIQFNYLAFDAHLFWVALFGWYVIFGAGPISFDRSLARGLAGSALPFANPLLRAARGVSDWLSTPFLLVLRLWLASALLAVAGSTLLGFMGPELLQKILPVRTAAHMPTPLLLAGAWLLALASALERLR